MSQLHTISRAGEKTFGYQNFKDTRYYNGGNPQTLKHHVKYNVITSGGRSGGIISKYQSREAAHSRKCPFR